MTTITFKDKVMASDSHIVGAYIDQLSADKIYQCGNFLIGCAGAVSDIKKFISYIDNGWREIDLPKEAVDTFEALAYDMSDGQLWYYDGSYTGVETGEISAIGSGQGFAMGAMLAGADASEAVAIASELDPYTGGEIKIYHLEEELEAPPEVEEPVSKTKKNKKKKHGKDS